MECSRVRIILLENADTVLPEEVRTAVEAHLAECRSCSGLREALGEQVRALGALPRIKAPDDLLERVRRQVEKPSPAKSLGERLQELFGTRRFFQLAATAAVALIVVGTLRVAMQQESMQKLSVTAPPPTVLQTPAPAPPAKPAESDAQSLRQQPAPSGGIGGARANTPAPAPMAAPSTAPAAGMLEKSFSAPSIRQEAVTLTLKVPAAREKSQARDSAQAPAAVAPPARGAAVPERGTAGQPGFMPKEKKSEGAARSSKALRFSEEDLKAAPTDRRSVLAEIRQAIARADGTILDAEPAQSSEETGELLAEVPAENLPSLLGRLRELGTVESSRTEAFHPQPGTTIRLTLKFDFP